MQGGHENGNTGEGCCYHGVVSKHLGGRVLGYIRGLARLGFFCKLNSFFQVFKSKPVMSKIAHERLHTVVWISCGADSLPLLSIGLPPIADSWEPPLGFMHVNNVEPIRRCECGLCLKI